MRRDECCFPTDVCLFELRISPIRSKGFARMVCFFCYSGPIADRPGLTRGIMYGFLEEAVQLS